MRDASKFFFQAEGGIRDFCLSRGLGDVYKRQDQMFEEIGQFPKVAFEMEEDSSMAGLVAQGFGIAVMPDIPILRSLSVKTLDIYNPPYERAVYLATLKQRYLSPVAKAFIRFVIEETA